MQCRLRNAPNAGSRLRSSKVSCLLTSTDVRFCRADSFEQVLPAAAVHNSICNLT